MTVQPRGRVSTTDVDEKTGQDVYVIGGSSAVVGGLLDGVVYDYVAMVLSSGDTVETYTFRDGGASGTITAVIVVTYTSSARTVLSTVNRTT